MSERNRGLELARGMHEAADGGAYDHDVVTTLCLLALDDPRVDAVLRACRVRLINGHNEVVWPEDNTATRGRDPRGRREHPVLAR